MLVPQRHMKIVSLVNERQSIRVSELSEICKVTEETIRKDLDKLEAEGKLIRSHGGAVSIEEQLEPPFFERSVICANEKREIAILAITHIHAGDRIILDGSSTAWYMASLLPDIDITVLTNSLKVAFELANREKIHVISTGGNLVGHSLYFVGPLAERSIDMYHVNKAFISCKGVEESRGISESNELGALVKRKMIENADHVFLLVDYSKFGVRSFAKVADIQKIHTVITDSNTQMQDIEFLKDRSIEVIQVQKD